MNLSKHFTLEEFIQSDTALRKGIRNQPTEEEVENLKCVASVLEQIREAVGMPIRVSSGYRGPMLNKAIGGSMNSAHVHGLAADISVDGMDSRELAKLVSELNLPMLDQLIYEGTWVHVGLSLDAPRHQVLTAKFSCGKAFYTVGIAEG